MSNSQFEELKAEQSRIWSSAPWERAQHMLARVHEHLVRALEPQAGQRWLDVATGAGAVALLAARAGADVTGVDLAPGLVETARRLAAEQGLGVRFDVGDAEQLPYEDGSFDVVSSSMGMIFAPDHAAVAREVTRLVRPGGRLGFSAWRPGVGFRPVTKPYYPPPPPEQGDPDDWGREEYVAELLGDAFELRFEEGEADFSADSAAELWELLTSSVGPFKELATTLEPERLAELRADFDAYVERFGRNGRAAAPSDYLLVLGQRR